MIFMVAVNVGPRISSAKDFMQKAYRAMNAGNLSEAGDYASIANAKASIVIAELLNEKRRD